jgi:hypothetical protein
VAVDTRTLGYGRSGNHISIFSKHPRMHIKVYVHHKEGRMEIDDLYGSLTSNHEKQSIGSGLYSCLLLVKGHKRCLVMNGIRHGSSSYKVLAEISILRGSSTHESTYV